MDNLVLMRKTKSLKAFLSNYMANFDVIQSSQKKAGKSSHALFCGNINECHLRSAEPQPISYIDSSYMT